MNNTFTYEKKKKLAEKISKLKKKDDIVKIFEIIYEQDQSVTENQNGLFMIFNNLNDATYHKIDLYMKSITKKQSSPASENTSDKKEFISYVQNEFPDQDHFNPKLKYSNKEKNIIKRQRYEKMITSEKDSDENIVYKKFDGATLSDSVSDVNKNEEVQPKGKKKTTASKSTKTTKKS